MRVITISANKTVIGVRYVGNDCILQENDKVSDVGELGQIIQEDGTFITPQPEPIDKTPTLEERMETLQQDNLILMDALATVFEEVLMLREEIGGIIA